MTTTIEEKPIHTLTEFYDLMDQTAQIRRKATLDVLSNREPGASDITSLRNALKNLKDAPEADSGKPFERHLRMDDDHGVTVDLDYEVTELARDITYLELGEAALKLVIEDQTPGLLSQADQLAQKLTDVLGSATLRSFITDRDGTVNNYCGRYRSSIQATYNAVFLTHFARSRATWPIVVTSGPLSGPGLLDVSVIPPKTYVMAASKGREYMDLSDNYGSFPAPEEQNRLLQDLHGDLKHLLEQPEQRKYGLIGSGLQVKFGQLTVARQDISGSVPEDESRAFLQAVTDLVERHDSEGHALRIEDTGLDIEIILTIGAGDDRKDFDKGDGVLFLDQELGLNLDKGPHLVCGDTFSDLPMLRATLERCPDTHAVFVTRKPELHKAVLELCPKAFLVAEPDILVLALHALSRGPQ
ncbi:MAG: hypothetical protein EA399_13150 [Desulfovibrionales bacterium]|nr:MAG: hypothetical protein EA399_13150 [Desulfovibrionales bacterium]